MPIPKTNRPDIERATLHNFFKLLSSGDFSEILKVVRRRTLNSLKFIRRMTLAIFGVYYDNPVVKKRREHKQLLRILKNEYGWQPPSLADEKLHIAIVVRDGYNYPKSSTFIRLVSPLTSLTLINKVSFELIAENNTNVPRDTQVCIVQRNAFDNPDAAKQLVSNLRATSTTLIIDSDDAFKSMDPAHPEHDVHSPTIDAFNYLIEEADQVWLSTSRLRKLVSHQARHAVVVHNSLDERIWQPRKEIDLATRKDKPLEMIYMGTVSHDADFEMIFPALDQLADEYPGAFRLTIIGVVNILPDRPWIRRIYQRRGGSIYPKFVRWYLKQGPFDIGLSPLIKSEFNRAKSDIKCLDYLAAGCVPVVSDLEPYDANELNRFLIRVGEKPSAWYERMKVIVSNPQGFRKKYAQTLRDAQTYIWERRNIERTADQLQDLLSELTGYKF